MNYKEFAEIINVRKANMGQAQIAFLPGDPDRVPIIASNLSNSKQIASKREFRSYIGEFNGTEVLVVSTGVGAPSTAVCVEQLAQLGVKIFIRVGTCGSIQSHVNIGDLVISDGAVRLEGTSLSFAPAVYPAISSHEVTSALKTFAVNLKSVFHIGLTASTDNFYQGQERYDSYSGFVPRYLQGSLEELRRMNVLNYEMEAAALLTMTRVMGLQSGCICGVVANRVQSENLVGAEEHEQIERLTALVAVNSIPYLKKLLGN